MLMNYLYGIAGCHLCRLPTSIDLTFVGVEPCQFDVRVGGVVSGPFQIPLGVLNGTFNLLPDPTVALNRRLCGFSYRLEVTITELENYPSGIGTVVPDVPVVMFLNVGYYPLYPLGKVGFINTSAISELIGDRIIFTSTNPTGLLPGDSTSNGVTGCGLGAHGFGGSASYAVNLP
jgi:hypothetical protein